MGGVVGVLLGAGSSRRLGRPKQTLPLGDTTVLGWTVRDAEASALDRVVLVVGGAADETPPTTRAEVVYNAAYGTGCASSLRAGLDAAGDAEAIVMLLGDMPGVDAAVIDAVVSAWGAAPTWAAVTEYADGLGHPFVFAAAAFPRCAACTATRPSGRSSATSPPIGSAGSGWTGRCRGTSTPGRTTRRCTPDCQGRRPSSASSRCCSEASGGPARPSLHSPPRSPNLGAMTPPMSGGLQEPGPSGPHPTDEPFWRNPGHGAKKRVAHYLYSVVGQGKTFNVDSLRDAIRKPDGSGVDEVDRRMRELREVGWQIRNYKDMATLAPNQLHLETVGDHIWEPGYRTARATALSARDRRAVYERDGHRCAVCAIDFGDEYPHLLEDGQHVKARPTIGHWVPRERGGTDDLSNLRPECHLCNEQSRNLTGTPVDPVLVRRKILELKKDDKRTLQSWLSMGRRSFSDLDTVWAELNQLPTPERELVRSQLEKMLGS